MQRPVLAYLRAAGSTQAVSTPTAPPSSSRVHLVDLLRLLALLQMVNGHTLDSVLAPDLREGHGFLVYGFFRGLVSVSFMLASGIAFHLTTISRLSGSAPKGTWPRVRRMFEIIAIGYLLRFPLGAWDQDPRVVDASMDRFAQIDVLQVIGVSLLALEALAHVFRDRRRVEIAAGVLAVIVLAVSPLTSRVVADRPWSFLTGWLGHGAVGGGPGSIFPFFPWSAYVFFGAALGALAFPEGGRTPARRMFVGLGSTALAATATTWILWRTPFSLWDPSIDYAAMPAFFVEKLAWVLTGLAVLAPLVARVKALPGPIATLSQQTLPIYVFHLLALHFPPMTLADRVGIVHSLREGLACSGGMLVMSCAFGLLWPRLSPFARHRPGKPSPTPATAPT